MHSEKEDEILRATMGQEQERQSKKTDRPHWQRGGKLTRESCRNLSAVKMSIEQIRSDALSRAALQKVQVCQIEMFAMLSMGRRQPEANLTS